MSRDKNTNDMFTQLIGAAAEPDALIVAGTDSGGLVQCLKIDGSGNLLVSGVVGTGGNASLTVGKATIGTTAICPFGNIPCRQLILSLDGSSPGPGTVYVGGSGVTTSTGFVLPNLTQPLAVSNTNVVFLIADSAGQVVDWIATN